MVPKKAEWNRVVPVGNGVCHSCHGKGNTPQSRGTHPCISCKRTGVCHMCDGKGVRFDGYNCEYCDSNYEKAEKKSYEAVGKNASIDEVIDAISQETTARKVWKRCDAARESFALDRITVKSRSEYEDILGGFMTHYSVKAMFHDRMDPENPFLTAEHYLAKIYGNPKFPYECARSGEAGGMRGLLDSIHEHAKKILTERVLKNTLDYFDMPERERLLREYVQKYGDQLPAKYRGQTAIMLLFEFCDVMIHHATVIEPEVRTVSERV